MLATHSLLGTSTIACVPVLFSWRCAKLQQCCCGTTINLTSCLLLQWQSCNTLVCGQLLMASKQHSFATVCWKDVVFGCIANVASGIWFCSVLLMMIFILFLLFLQPTTCCLPAANDNAGNEVDATGLKLSTCRGHHQCQWFMFSPATQVLTITINWVLQGENQNHSGLPPWCRAAATMCPNVQVEGKS